MKRVGFMLLLGGLVLLDTGCRRRSSTPQPPVNVLSEKDYIWVKPEGDQIKQPPPPVIPNAIPEKVDPKVQAAKRQEEEKKAAEAELDELRKLAALYMKYRGNTLNKNATLDGFRIEVRRAGQRDLYDAIDNKQMVVVIEAVAGGNGNEILAYRSKEIMNPKSEKINPKDGTKTYDVEIPVFSGTRQNIVFYKAAPLAMALREQPLHIVNWAFSTYRKEKDIAADQRSPAGFKRYLRENTPPSMYKLVADEVLLVADPRGKSVWIACEAKADGKKGHLAMKDTGTTDFITADEVKASFPKQP